MNILLKLMLRCTFKTREINFTLSLYLLYNKYKISNVKYLLYRKQGSNLNFFTKKSSSFFIELLYALLHHTFLHYKFSGGYILLILFSSCVLFIET